MALFLLIDTASDKALACLANEQRILALAVNEDQKNHAAFIQPAIQQLAEEAAIGLNQLDAIAVTGGPGSYTGLRVGMATAKGLCYALQKPLIVLNTLELIAMAAQGILKADSQLPKGDFYYCPMIDARRMEVFTAMYNADMQEVEPVHAKILDGNSYSNYSGSPIVFCGKGSAKFRPIHPVDTDIFIEENYPARIILQKTIINYLEKEFSAVAYAEPLYGKAFYNTQQPK
jgi:tRNA threonylcarbamoyladenosine biosynthesis protein TsaB